MHTLEFWFFIFLLIFLPHISSSKGDECVSLMCGKFVVRFPFRLKDQQPEHWRFPGFELSCTERNETVLELPFSGKFLVRNINYTNQEIEIYDPNSCLPGRLFYFDLSDSPFKGSRHWNYAFFNCSKDFIDPENIYTTITCLDNSSSTYNVRFTHSRISVRSLSLEYCNIIRAVSVPLPIPYRNRFESNDDLSLFLTWNKPRCGNCESKGGQCGFKSNTNPAIGCSGIQTRTKGNMRNLTVYFQFITISLFFWTHLALFTSSESNDMEISVLTYTLDSPVWFNCRQLGSVNSTQISVSNLLLSTNNCSSCTINWLPTSPTGAWRKKMAIGLSIGVFVLLIITTVAVTRACKKTDMEEKEKQIKIEKFLENYKALKPTRYSYADIKRMTNKFKNKLGEGGYGSVYEGKLTNGIPVAVKILNISQGNGEEFINEVNTIGRIHHVNVVRLLGFSADGFRRALIYEFMPNESLKKYIFSSEKHKNPYLCWEKLHDIAINIARGMEYLHQGCDQRILHFDIKPQNILLDHNLNPKISDFGLAKLCSKGDNIVSMTAARGTMGYIAPELFSRNFGNVSYKSDVYSFGMLLLEMLGGKKNMEVNVEKPSQVYFPEWIYNRVVQGQELGLEIEKEEDPKIARNLAIVALWCIQWYPVDRPSMNSVIQMLEGNTENLNVPPNPFASSPSATTSKPLTDQPQQIELSVILEEPGERNY